MRKSMLVTLSMAAAAVTSLGFTSAAIASPLSSTQAVQPSSSAASDSVTYQDDPVCVAARAAAKEPGKCQIENVGHADGARLATPAEIKQYGSLRSADGTTLDQAAAAGSVYIRSWSQEQRGLYYVNWKERQTGKFLYNGSYAWVSNRHGYTGGFHNCGLGYGVGYSVDNTYCDVYAQDTPNVQNYDAYSVSVLVKGAPIHFTHSMSTYAHRDGSYSQYWA